MTSCTCVKENGARRKKSSTRALYYPALVFDLGKKILLKLFPTKKNHHNLNLRKRKHAAENCPTTTQWPNSNRMFDEFNDKSDDRAFLTKAKM